MAEADEKKMQEKYIILQLLQQNLESIKQQMEIIQQQHMEVNYAKNALKDIGKLDDGNEIMTPIGSGVFVKASIIDTKNVRVNLGMNVIAGKTVNEALAFVEERKREIEKTNGELEEHGNEIVNKINEISTELQELARKA